MFKLKKALPLLALASLSYLLLKPKKVTQKTLNLPPLDNLYRFWLVKHPFLKQQVDDINQGILYEAHEHYRLDETTLDYYLGANPSILY